MLNADYRENIERVIKVMGPLHPMDAVASCPPSPSSNAPREEMLRPQGEGGSGCGRRRGAHTEQTGERGRRGLERPVGTSHMICTKGRPVGHLRLVKTGLLLDFFTDDLTRQARLPGCMPSALPHETIHTSLRSTIIQTDRTDPNGLALVERGIDSRCDEHRIAGYSQARQGQQDR